MREGMGRLITQLQDHGHLDAHATAARLPGGGDWRILVVEGPRYRLTELALETSTREDSAAFAGALGLAAGGWASPTALGDAIARAVDGAVAGGHPYARLAISAFDWDSAGARVRLSGALGPRVTIQSVRLEGLGVTRPELVKRAMGPLEGRPFDPIAALVARDRAAQLGLFQQVTYEGLEGRGDWSQADLVYKFVEPKYYHAEGVVGLQSDHEVVGLARVDLDNLAGTGRAASLSWESRGAGRQDFAARYAEPYLFGSPLRLELAISQELEDTLWTHTIYGLQGVFPLGARGKGELGLDQERVVQPVADVAQASLQTTRSAFQTDRRDDPLFARRGWFMRLEGAESFKTEHLRDGTLRKSNVGSANVAFELLRPLGVRPRAPGLSLEVRWAGRFSSARVLDPWERLPLGGAASLRGFDERQFLVDRYVLSRLEWRLPVGLAGQRVALFWDHATTATRETVLGEERLARGSHDGVGFGLRLATRSGLAGLDYGLEPSRPPTEGKIHLRLVSSF
jgi:outer membrane protein assembly factor BamA